MHAEPDLSRGFFKVYYKIDQSSAWSRGLAFIGLMTAIMQKQDLKRVTYFGGQEIPVGSFAVVISSWAPELGVNRITLSRMLKTLSEEDKFISIENVNNRFCIVSVLKHEAYQSCIDEDEQPKNNQRTTGSTTKGTTSEQSPIRDIERYITPQFLEFARKYQEHQAKTHGNRAPKITDDLIQRCAETVGRLVLTDGFDLEYIRKALAWARNHEIWGSNLLSLAELRKKKGGDRTKFQKLASQYDAANKSPRYHQPAVVTDVSTVYPRRLG